MTEPLFDHALRALRRDRAVRIGVESFLYDRAFAECLDRLADINQRFSAVLLAGCPSEDWPARISQGQPTIIEPGRLMAGRVGAQVADLETMPFGAGQFDLCICVGLLETANNLPLAMAALRFVLKLGGLLLGAAVGGESFPTLRRAMLAADATHGQAAPRVHSRIDAPGLGQLLSGAGFASPVVDVDRVSLAYRSFDHLVRDLRAAGCTNIMSARPRRAISQTGLEAARRAFSAGQERVIEQVDILHFAAWATD